MIMSSIISMAAGSKGRMMSLARMESRISAKWTTQSAVADTSNTPDAHPTASGPSGDVSTIAPARTEDSVD